VAGFSLVLMWLVSKLFLVVLPLLMVMRLAARAQVRVGSGGEEGSEQLRERGSVMGKAARLARDWHLVA
jgi:hypothetical protein